jgi:hypothetical protein
LETADDGGFILFEMSQDASVLLEDLIDLSHCQKFVLSFYVVKLSPAIRITVLLIRPTLNG